MKKTFKYRIHANKETITKTEKWLSLCCELYNACLAQRKYAYRMQGVTVSGYDQANELHEIKDSIPEFKSVGSQVLQNVIERLNGGMNAFFRRIRKGGEKAGFPRFKSWRRYDSFTLKEAGWHLDGRYLWIHKVGRFKMNLSRPIKGKIKTITIRRTSTNKWYACFSCDEAPEKKLEPNNKVIGLDMGIASYLTDSEGNHIENPKWLRYSQRILRIKQRNLARSIKGSNRREDDKLQVAKLHEKIASQRLDFQHKLANKYIKEYGTIVVEDLNIKGMVKNHKLAGAISDCGWGQFFQLLKYKAEEAGREIIESYRFKPTSKACSSCGEVNHKLKLSDRDWVCMKCGAIHDRDENAAKNIMKSGFGQNLQTLTYNNS